MLVGVIKLYMKSIEWNFAEWFFFSFSVPNAAAAGLQTMANASDSQPITITNSQGQQITVIPSQALQQQIRPANANIIQMPNNMSGLPFPVQNIPGLGNVQVSIFEVKMIEILILMKFFG